MFELRCDNDWRAGVNADPPHFTTRREGEIYIAENYEVIRVLIGRDDDEPTVFTCRVGRKEVDYWVSN